MQPDSESNKRIRNKLNGTPNRKKISTVTPQQQKTELMKKNSTQLDDTNNRTQMNISHYFRKLNDKSLLESPATQLLNRMEDEIATTDKKNNLIYNELRSSRASLIMELDNQDVNHYNQHEIGEIINEGNGVSSTEKTFTSDSSNALTEMDFAIDSLKIMSLSNATPTLRSEQISPAHRVHKHSQNTINTLKTMSFDNDSFLSCGRRKTIIAQNLPYRTETVVNNSPNDANIKSSKSRKNTTYSLQAMDESELKEHIFVAASPQPLNNCKTTKRRRTLLPRQNQNKSPAIASKDNLIMCENNTMKIKMKRRTLYSKKSLEESMTEIKATQEKEISPNKRTPRKQKIKNCGLDSPKTIWKKINDALQESTNNRAIECAVANTENEAIYMRAVSECKPSRRRRTLYTPQNMDLDSGTKNFPTLIPVLKKTPGDVISMPSTDVSNVSLNGSNTILQQQQQNECLTISSPIKSAALSPIAVAEKELLVDDIEKTTATLPFRSTRAPANRRRTMFDASMDIIEQRLQCINQTTTNRRSVPHMLLDYNTPNNKNNQFNKKANDIIGDSISSPAISKTNDEIKKKRKLFVPNTINNNSDDIINTPPSSQSSKAQTTPSTSAMLANTRGSAMTPINQTRAIQRVQLYTAKVMPSPFVTKSGATSAKNTLRTRRSTLDFEFIQNKVVSGNKNSYINNDKSNNSSNNNNSNNNNNNNGNNSNNTGTSSLHNINGKDADATIKQTLPVLSYTNMNKNEINVIREAVATLGGFRLNGDVSDESSHLITSDGRRTLNSLRALVRGLWILRYDWILESMKAGHWIAEEPYELDGFSRAIKICRSERQAFGATYKSELFHNFGPFYVASHCYPLSRQSARELITLCGGKLVKTPSRARYIIGEWKGCHQYVGIKLCISSYWILDSITEMQVLNVNKYVCKPPNILNKNDGSGDNNDSAGGDAI